MFNFRPPTSSPDREMLATRALRQSRQLPAAAEQLYQSYKETANTFKSYNFKEYFLRQADRKFQQAFPFEASGEQLQSYLKQQEQDLNVLRRAALVNALYEAPKLVVEVRLLITHGSGRTRCPWPSDVQPQADF